MSTVSQRSTKITARTGGTVVETPSNRVYTFILDKIRSGHWPVNSKILTEPQLCETLNVSRVAVREAIERLSALGLLAKKQGSGTFVAEVTMTDFINSLLPVLMIDKKDILTILEFRRYFEYGTVDMFTKYHEPEELRRLEENYDKYAEAIASGNLDSEYTGQLDFEFHRIIALGSHNNFAIKTSEVIMEIMRQHLIYFSVTNYTANAVVYHREIVRAIKMGESTIASNYMQKHIDLVIARIRSLS